MDNQLTGDTSQDQPELLTLAGPDEPSVQPLPTPVAERRTEMAVLGLGDNLKKPRAETYSNIAEGRENVVRTEAAAQLDFKQSMAKQAQIRDLAAKKGSPLTLDEVDVILRNGSKASPDDVIERSYAKKYISGVSEASGAMQDTVFDKAQKEIPGILPQIEERADSMVSKMEFARTKAEDIENEIHGQGWVPYLADQAKGLFQPYQEIKMRGLNKDVGVLDGGLLLGDNLKEQADKLFMLPYEDFKTRFTEITGKLRKDNPSLAKQFADFVVNQSSSDRILNNVFTVLAVPDAKMVGEGGLALGRKVSVYNRANQAFKDVVRSAGEVSDIMPVRASIAEGAGNVSEAATVRASDNIIKTLDGKLDATKDISEKLTSNFRLDAKKLENNPGSLSREQLTRLQDGFYRTGDDLLQTALDAARVNRTPLPLAMEDAVRAYNESLRGKFPGLDNAIADISPPKLEPITNTYHTDVTLTNIGGDLFSSPETAANFARLHGFADVAITEGKGVVRVEEAKVIGSKTDLKRSQQLTNSIPEAEKSLKKWRAEVRDKNITPEAKIEAQQQVKFFKETIEKYKKDASEISGRLTSVPARVEQDGLGFKIVVRKPYQETDDAVRDALIGKRVGADGHITFSGDSASSASQDGMTSWKNAALGKLRGADDTLSVNETKNRKVATYTQSLFDKWASERAKYIEQIATGVIKEDPVTGEKISRLKAIPESWTGRIKNKQMFKEFNDVLDRARNMEDKNGLPGYFFESPGELEDHYMRWYKRLPTFPEVQGYFAHVQLTEGNRVLSEIAEFRNRVRIGAEQHQVTVGDKVSGFFDGIAQKVFPGGEDQIILMGKNPGDEKVHMLGGNSISPQKLEEYRNGVKTGQYKIIRIYEPGSYPLRDFSQVAGNERIRYILTETAESKPIEFNHVNRRGGGHFEYDYAHYIKQAQIIPQGVDGSFRHLYVGDTTVMPIGNRAMGKDIARKLDEVRKLIAKEDLDGAQALAEKTLPMEWKEVSGWFKPSRGPKGQLIPARLDVSEPFYVVPKNKNIYDIDKSLEARYEKTFKDGTKSGSDAAQFKVAFNTERDSTRVNTINDYGTVGNPLYKYEPAKLLDPIPTMNRALKRAINSTFMDDYKISAVEHWLTEATPLLKASESEVRSAPFWHFNNPDFKPSADTAKVMNLKSNQLKIQGFTGMPSTFDTWVHGVTQKLADDFYTKFGPEDTRGTLAKAVTILPTWALSKTQDPVSFMRSVAFNAKLGLFAVPQLLVQAQGHASIWAIDPKHGTVGTYAMMLHQWSRLNKNPEILKFLDEYATKLNGFGSRWRPGEFTEAMGELERVGFGNVAGEYAVSDQALSNKFIKNQFGNFLDAGSVFFKEGEKSTRLTAWYTAFREFRDVNPTGALTGADRATILNKADLLTTNMSRASSNALQGGVFGLTTQFLSYQIRLAELFLGKRLGETATERTMARARMIGMYGALYGAPSALGLTGLPLGDTIRQKAIDEGYVVGDDFIKTLTMEGLPSMAMALATGKGDYQAGTYFNVGNRFGSQGFTQIREAFASDNTMWKILTGASGSVLMSTFKNANPFWQAASSMVSNKEEDNSFKLSTSDMAGLFNEASSVSSARKLLWALNTGRWMSKNEAYVADVSAAKAMFMTLTGLTLQEQDDMFAKSSIVKSEQEDQKQTMKEVIKDYQRGLDAVRDENPEEAKKMFTRVRARFELSNFPEEKRQMVLGVASKGYEPQITTSNWKFIQETMTNKTETRVDQLTRQLNLDDKRK
jgi:hypothetical protein